MKNWRNPDVFKRASSSILMQNKVHATNAHTLGFQLFFSYIKYICEYLYKYVYIQTYVNYCDAARETTGMPEKKLKANITLSLRFTVFCLFYILSICLSKILYIYNFCILNCLTFARTQRAFTANNCLSSLDSLMLLSSVA